MVPSSTVAGKVGEYENGTHQCLYLWRELQHTPAPLEDTLSFSNESSSYMFEALLNLILLHWVPALVSLCVNPLEVESQFPPAFYRSPGHKPS